MPKLLALLSNPDDNVKLRMDRELKEIENGLNYKSKFDFSLKTMHAISIDDLPSIMMREKPDLLHFSGHGNENSLSFEDEAGHSHNITTKSLKEIFKHTSQSVNCLLLNACYTDKLAKTLNEYFPYSIGFPSAVEDDNARIFACSFYQSLSYGKQVEHAFNVAIAVLKSAKYPGAIPKLFTNKTHPLYDDRIFKEPKIIAQFKEKNDKVKACEYGGYFIIVSVSGLPSSATDIIYEYIDESVKKKFRFDPIKNTGKTSTSDDCFMGDLQIRVWLWIGKEDQGLGIQSSLVEALIAGYNGNIPKQCKKAFEYISTH